MLAGHRPCQYMKDLAERSDKLTSVRRLLGVEIHVGRRSTLEIIHGTHGTNAGQALGESSGGDARSRTGGAGHKGLGESGTGKGRHGQEGKGVVEQGWSKREMREKIFLAKIWSRQTVLMFPLDLRSF